MGNASHVRRSRRRGGGRVAYYFTHNTSPTCFPLDLCTSGDHSFAADLTHARVAACRIWTQGRSKRQADCVRLSSGALLRLVLLHRSMLRHMLRLLSRVDADCVRFLGAVLRLVLLHTAITVATAVEARCRLRGIFGCFVEAGTTYDIPAIAVATAVEGRCRFTQVVSGLKKEQTKQAQQLHKQQLYHMYTIYSANPM